MQNDYKVTFKNKWYTCVWTVLLSFFLLCGCVDGGTSANDGENSSSATEKNQVNITLVESMFFQTENSIAQVAEGEDFTAVLQFLDDYTFDSCDYKNYETKDLGNGRMALTLKNVERSTRVTIISKLLKNNQGFPEMTFTLQYDFNGGAAQGKDGDAYTETQTQNQHLRPNTWNGVGLERDGYTLIGWNTKKDGSGEHIGLGSRVTVENGGSITLYAEWRAWISAELFTHSQISSGKIVLTGYLGGADVEPFVIPAKIGGMDVVTIGSTFTENMPCGRITAKTLVLPNTIQTIANHAFDNSAFEEVYFFDNVELIDEEAFPYYLKTYHVNAYEAPCYLGVNNSTSYADSVDRLIVNADKKKLILFSGCSFTYGVHSDVVDKAYKGEYVVCNIGVNGDINGAFQMEVVLQYLKKDDVLVHTPEQMSPAQTMASLFVDNRMFIMTEGNYDILSIPDFSNVDFFEAFMDYSRLKAEEKPTAYTQGSMEYFNVYGDFMFKRSYDESNELERDKTYSNDTYYFEPGILTEEGIAMLAGYYDEAKAKGAKVCISYAPINGSAMKKGEIQAKGVVYEEKFRTMLAQYGYTPISNVSDYIFLGRYFYDSDYHLNDYGALLRTRQLLADLQKAGVQV